MWDIRLTRGEDSHCGFPGFANAHYGEDKVKYSNPITGPEGSRKLRLPDFKTFGTFRW